MLIVCIFVVVTVAANTAEKFDKFNERVKRDVLGVPGKDSKRAVIYLPKPAPIDYNATNLYDASTERCCKGSVHKGSPRAHLECCGANIREKSTQICCEGVVHDLQIGFLCCGNQTYDTTTAICCGTTVIPLQQGAKPEDAVCCGKSAYDTKTQLCCYDYKPDNQFVPVTKQSETDNICCGTKTYNTLHSTCCYTYTKAGAETVILPIVGNKTSCCGQVLIDDNTELCCDEEIVSRTPGKKAEMCCGKQIYNYNKQVCCSNTAGMNAIFDKTSSPTYCCGNELYDPKEHVCCYNNDRTNTILSKPSPESRLCCGKTALYDYTKQICCNEKVYDNKDGDKQCCGLEIINSKEQVCCVVNNKLAGVTKQEETDTGCCGGVTYDSRTALCCNNNNTETIVKKTHPDDGMCCGLRTYQYGKDICCQGASSILYPYEYQEVGLYNRQCCGDKAINTTEGYCCGTEEIKNSQANPLSCCGSGVNAKTYNPSKQLCCYDATNPDVKPTTVSKSEGNSCCGSTAYNYTPDLLCCKGKLLKSNENSELCCGDKLYDNQKEVCCGENILEKKGGSSQCCYNSITDEDQDCITRVYPTILQKFLQHLQEYRALGGGGPLEIEGKKK